jgi:hypothetical protein
MTKLKLLSAALIAASTLAAPAMARETQAHLRHHVHATSAPDEGRYADARTCVREPAVGAYATAPWENGPPCEPGTGY